MHLGLRLEVDRIHEITPVEDAGVRMLLHTVDHDPFIKRLASRNNSRD